MWPPPETWTAVRVSWRTMLDDPEKSPKKILEWIENAPGGQWHLSGWEEYQRQATHGAPWNGVDGFEFRFERAEDALLFRLTWT